MSDNFWSGVLCSAIAVVIIVIFTLFIPATGSADARLEGTEVLERLEIRILMTDGIDIGEAVHFATEDGYFVYYDGILYEESK